MRILRQSICAYYEPSKLRGMRIRRSATGRPGRIGGVSSSRVTTQTVRKKSANKSQAGSSRHTSRPCYGLSVRYIGVIRAGRQSTPPLWSCHERHGRVRGKHAAGGSAPPNWRATAGACVGGGPAQRTAVAASVIDSGADALPRVVAPLEHHGIPFMLTGSFASSARFTAFRGPPRASSSSSHLTTNVCQRSCTTCCPMISAWTKVPRSKRCTMGRCSTHRLAHGVEICARLLRVRGTGLDRDYLSRWVATLGVDSVTQAAPHASQ